MSALVAVDDTDSRQTGMCTTYLGARLADQLAATGATVERSLLIRCHPAVEYKTRGNAAVCLHTDAAPERAFETVRNLVDELAARESPRTNPGIVVADHDTDAIPEDVGAYSRAAMRSRVTRARALALIERHGYRHAAWDNGRGVIGALAALGAAEVWDDWTYEFLAYRPAERWGTQRTVGSETVFDAADRWYPTVWDTVDRTAGTPVCVPHTPGPVLYGIRGDDPGAVRAVADAIKSEPVARTHLYATNQGTDAHLRTVPLADIEDGQCVRTTGTVSRAPETRPGGHVFFALEEGDVTVPCAAFEPTKRFRDRVRDLHVGDRLTACGEVTDGTIKLEKFALRSLRRSSLAVPTCPDCGRSMESAGAEQGYRCRDCGTVAPGKAERPLDRTLERGWYEVPPVARRHVAKPLIRGGFDAPIHPER